MDASVQKRLDAIRSFPSTSAAIVMERIRHGDDAWTRALSDNADVPSMRRVVNAGAVDFILQKLQHAMTTTWDETLDTMGKPADLASPSIWIDFLQKVVAGNTNMLQPKATEKLRTKIAKKIGPLTSAMVDMDKNRSLFGQQDLWYLAVVHYAALVRNLFQSAFVIPIILSYENGKIRDFLVRMQFLEFYGGELRDSLRNHPMISNGTKNLGLIQAFATGAIHELVSVPANYGIFSAESKATLKGMANIRVSPCSDVTLSTGIMQIAWEPSDPMLKDNISYSYLMYIVRMFLMGLGEECFGIADLEVRLVKICQKDLASFPPLSTGDHVLYNLLYSLLCQVEDEPGKAEPTDEKLARAIDSGMIEVIAGYLLNDPYNQYGIVSTASEIISMLEQCVLMYNTNKALNKNTASIRTELNKLRERPSLWPECDTLQMIVHEASMTQSADDSQVNASCWGCYKEFPNTVKPQLCAKCNRARYCSRECQIKDWKEGGHKNLCNTIKAYATRGIKKPAFLERNLSMAGDALFGENVTGVLLQAELLGLNILESVVVLDFQSAQPHVYVLEQSDLSKWDCLVINADVKNQFACNRSTGAISAVCIAAKNDHGVDTLFKAFPQSVAPVPSNYVPDTEQLPKWLAAQRNISSLTPLASNLDAIRTNDLIKKELIEKLRSPSTVPRS